MPTVTKQQTKATGPVTKAPGQLTAAAVAGLCQPTGSTKGVHYSPTEKAESEDERVAQPTMAFADVSGQQPAKDEGKGAKQPDKQAALGKEGGEQLGKEAATLQQVKEGGEQ